MRIFAVLVSAVAVVHCGPVSIISSYRSNAKADKDGNLFNSQHRKGYSEFGDKNHEQGEHAGSFLNGHLEDAFKEDSAAHKNHLDEGRYNEDQFAKKASVGSREHGNSVGHSRGFHKSGFHNTYHKDESGSNSSYYDDSDDNGEEAVYENQKGAYGDFRDSHRNGGGLDSARYDLNKGTHKVYNRGDKRGFNDVNERRNNLRHYADQRVEGVRGNFRNRDGHEGSYQEYNRPAYYEDDEYYDAPVSHGGNTEYKTITVFEDPRYVHPRWKPSHSDRWEDETWDQRDEYDHPRHIIRAYNDYDYDSPYRRQYY
ncbi:NKAP family protein-like [Aethina tumida]|uniref:NKAP family protein-like n=1 Tax=Aethina tumida TaxID=116153 RepID=UPI002147AB89|nr:NKAP family protein-like [Aethina tumida]